MKEQEPKQPQQKINEFKLLLERLESLEHLSAKDVFRNIREHFDWKKEKVNEEQRR